MPKIYKVNLLPFREFPQKITVYSRDEVKIKRPEDLAEYDYIASLNANSNVDFSKFRIVSSDLNWEGINYLLPIAQRLYIDKKDETLIDFFEGFLWLLDYDNGIDDLIKLMSIQDVELLLQWLVFLSKNQYGNFVDVDLDDLKRHISYLSNYLNKGYK